jgi:hypothetical protein
VHRSASAQFLALVVLASLAGCGGGPKPSTVTADEPSQEAAAENDVQVEVISHSFRDANVYLHVGGSRQRLGFAGGNSTSYFKVPWNAQLANAVEAKLSAERIGDTARAESSAIQLVAGARIVWTLNGHFNETSLEVY